ncbi:hypothetical protein Scep_010175 [Stephania cephalantha]|uniref:Uncharacterized protein n=1 Tax=Stephania cephalantha TaxID=152367 RepID=A0AAP0JVB8_9MAGN
MCTLFTHNKHNRQTEEGEEEGKERRRGRRNAPGRRKEVETSTVEGRPKGRGTEGDQVRNGDRRLTTEAGISNKDKKI